MALDVQTSLANALFASERAAATKARANEKAATRAADAKTNAAALESATPARFDTLVSEKAPASAGPQKAAASTASSRNRGAMPGRIAGHQDTVVAPREDSTKAPAEAAAKEANDKPEAAEARKPEAAAHEKPENSDAPGAAASAQDDTTQTKAEDAKAEDQAGQDQGQQAGQQDAGDSAQQDTAADGTTSTEAAATDAGTTAQVGGEGAMLVGAAAVAGVVGGQASDVSSAGTAAGAGVGAVSGEGVAATPLASLTEGDAAPALAAGTSAAPQTPVAKEGINAASAKAESASAAPDTGTQPGMGQHVADQAEQITQEARDGTAAKAETLAKGMGEVAPEGKTKAAGHSSANEAPTLRGSVFTQVLDDLSAVHGLNRGQDFLTTLDRPVAAAAQANRSADVQRPTPLQMLPIEIGMQAVRGAREFQIRLDPAELGRVDVKLHINEKGEVNASLMVERPETLQLLRRDATTLTQAFEQAGLKQGENALSFSLKGESQQGQQQQNARNTSVKDGEDAALNAQIGEIAMRRVMIPNSSLDRMV